MQPERPRGRPRRRSPPPGPRTSTRSSRWSRRWRSGRARPRGRRRSRPRAGRPASGSRRRRGCGAAPPGRGPASCRPSRRCCGPRPRRRRPGIPPPARAARPSAAARSPAASRAAARAMSVDVDAVSVSRPSKVRPAGPARRAASPTTTCSSSVPIGDVRHSIGFWPRAAVHISPRIPGADARRGEVGQEARVLPVRGVGQDQAIDVGRGSRPSGSGSSGAAAGKAGRMEPGSTAGQDVARLDRRQVVGHRVDHRVGGRPEPLRVHVRQPLDLRRGRGRRRSPGRPARPCPLALRPSCARVYGAAGRRGRRSVVPSSPVTSHRVR